MLVLEKTASAETSAKNSRFLSEVFPVDSPEAARNIWRGQKKRYDNGGHIVYAFVVGPQGNVSGCSDDGEPSGTAGRPTLEVLKGGGVTNLLLTTARWFGGTKLGTGGLVRAYTEAAQAVMALAATRELTVMRRLDFSVSYGEYETVKRLLTEAGFEINGENFADAVRFSGEIREDSVRLLHAGLNDLTRGRVIWHEETEI